MLTLAKQAGIEMKQAAYRMITADELYHMLNCKPMRSDRRYLDNCIAQDFNEVDLKGVK